MEEDIEEVVKEFTLNICRHVEELGISTQEQ